MPDWRADELWFFISERLWCSNHPAERTSCDSIGTTDRTRTTKSVAFRTGQIVKKVKVAF